MVAALEQRPGWTFSSGAPAAWATECLVRRVRRNTHRREPEDGSGISRPQASNESRPAAPQKRPCAGVRGADDLSIRLVDEPPAHRSVHGVHAKRNRVVTARVWGSDEARKRRNVYRAARRPATIAAADGRRDPLCGRSTCRLQEDDGDEDESAGSHALRTPSHVHAFPPRPGRAGDQVAPIFAVKSCRLPVRVSFHIAWNAPGALDASPWWSPIHHAPCLVPPSRLPCAGSNGVALTRRGALNRNGLRGELTKTTVRRPCSSANAEMPTRPASSMTR